MATLEAEARELVNEHGVALLAVDGIQDIRPAKPTSAVVVRSFSCTAMLERTAVPGRTPRP
ncbi:hypothetical protein [Streptomyces sp. NPDC004728]|uniref:hypothetical protein n=1 Tax=Streptomyces sp. NPDC004728 TaxID=3154289 RepID=UPI0033ADEFE8